MSGPSKRTRSSESLEGRTRLEGVLPKPLHAEHTFASIAEESIQKDLDEADEEPGDHGEHNSDLSLSRTVSRERSWGPHSMVGSHRQPSYMTAASRPFLGALTPETIIPIDQERETALSEERSLLRDNNIIPPKHPLKRRESQTSTRSGRSLRQRISISGISIRRSSSRIVEEEQAARQREDQIEPTETTALLNTDTIDPEAAYGGEDDPKVIDQKWEEAVLSGRIQTTWQRELVVLLKYSIPLIFTFLLQVSLTMTSVFTVGHIGENELGAVSLGSMTANITGYAVYYGLATSLDTLCAQAYGSGKKELVGLQLQRMVYFLWAITIPIAIVWLAGTQILMLVVPEPEIASAAGLYLKILVLGAPAYALFESAKRFVQAQGRFEATMYVLLTAAPINILLHWLFVWHFKWGFIGCPIAVVITENLLPLFLFLYVRFFVGLECWPGFTRKAFHNWWPMIRLAIPGWIMVMAEMLAFEILVLASARISATHLAAQTILQSIIVMAYQVPYPLSIAASTRVANLIGASLPEAAKKTTRVTFVLGSIIGTINMILVFSLRNYIPKLYTNEQPVVDLAARTLPINAAFQLFDALAAQCNGVLRGLGKQEFGGYVSLLAYYAIGIPISFGAAFGLHWDLYGLWLGPATSLLLVAIVTGTYLIRTSWQKASEEATARNAVD